MTEADKPDTEATEYERTLTDAELVQLAVDISLRIAALPPEIQMRMPMQQIENHHLIGMLECFIGPEEALRVREWHLSWLDTKLDQIEAQMRVAVLSDLPGFP